MNEPLFLKPVFQTKIWGGQNIKPFAANLPEGKIGEMWAISAHPNGLSVVLNGEFKGENLKELWENHQELFGYQGGSEFPLLTKILDAQSDLSIQVHPNDEYAKIHEKQLGKTECWYVLEAKPGAKLVYGSTAQTKEELRDMIVSERFTDLIKEKPVKKGDFVYVPSGTIHALTAGTMVLETQQSSDVTYRVYDYDRPDENTGKLRPLHLDQAIEVTSVPWESPKINPRHFKRGTAQITDFLTHEQSPYFDVWRIENDGNNNRFEQFAPFLLMTVIDGTGTLSIEKKSYDLKKGMSLIIPNSVRNFSLTGKLDIISSYPYDD